MNRQFGAFAGLAMVLIVLNHAISFGLEAQVQNGFPEMKGGLSIFLSTLQTISIIAVPIFFFISGSFVSYAAQGNPPHLSSRFLWSSLRHILIPYIIWSIISYFLVYFQHHETYTFAGYVKNILVGYPYHFIPLLLAFYVLSPLLLIVAWRHRLILLIVIAAYQLFTVNVVTPGYIGIVFPSWTSRFVMPTLRTTFAQWGIYFPFGLVYGLHAIKILPWLKHWKWVLIGATVIVFCLGGYATHQNVKFHFMRLIWKTTFVLSIPVISRNQLPWFRNLEKVGKRSYGLYLTHLIILNLSVWIFHLVTPGIIGNNILFLSLLFAIGLLIPLGLMELASRSPGRRMYRYIFG